MKARWLGMAILAGALAAAGCAGTRNACWLTEGRNGPSAGHEEPVSVALWSKVQATHLPIPDNDAEAVVFRAASRSLAEVTCEGSVVPGLAQDWMSADGSKTWMLRLRENVSAERVRSRWLENLQLSADETPWLTSVLDSSVVRVEDSRTLRVDLRESLPDFPFILSHPALAIPHTEFESEELISIAIPGDSGAPTRMEFAIRNDDPREFAISTNRHATILEERDVEIARHGVPFREIDLPGNRRYLYLSPAGTEQLLDRDELAHVVSPHRARPIESPFFETFRRAAPWKTRLAASVVPSPEPPRKVLYPKGDRTARALAERIAVILGDAQARTLTTEPLTRRPFAHALRQGSHACVASVVRQYATEDLQWKSLHARAPWLHYASQLVPLIETSNRLIVHEGLQGISCGYDGVPRFDRAVSPAPTRETLP